MFIYITLNTLNYSEYVKLPWIDHNAMRIQDGGAIVE